MSFTEGTKVHVKNQEDMWTVMGVGYLSACVIVQNDRTGRLLDVFEDLLTTVKEKEDA